MKKIMFFILMLFILYCFPSCVLLYEVQNPKFELRTGDSIDVCDDIVVIGSSVLDRWGGYVLVLQKEDSVWSQKALFNMRDIAFGLRGPVSISASENYIALGFDGRWGQKGFVVVLYKDSEGIWRSSKKFAGENSKSNDYFGYIVSVCGNMLAVSAMGTENVYIYSLHEKEHTLKQVLTIPNMALNSMKLTKDFLVVGQPYTNECVKQENDAQIIMEEVGTCLLYKYDKQSDSFILFHEIKPALEDKPIHFGYKVETDGENIIIGAANSYLYNFSIRDKTLYNIPYKYSDTLLLPNVYSYKYSVFDGKFFISDTLFKIEKGKIEKLLDLKIKNFDYDVYGSHEGVKDIVKMDELKRIENIQFSESAMYNNLLVATAFYACDKEYHINAFSAGKDIYRENQGNVYIVRLSDDGNYKIEACIARKTVKENGRKKVVFYDKLQEQ